MPSYIVGSSNALQLRVNAQTTGGMSITVQCDFSLQRHYYPSLDGAQAKLQNSILYAAVSMGQLEIDLHHLGQFLEHRVTIAGTTSPSIGAQFAAAGRAWMLGANVQEAAAAGDRFQLHDDYVLQSGRTWRVDNVSLNRQHAPNHCYPIAGPQLWANVSQAEFAAAAALRWLEREMETRGVREPLSKKWNSMRHMSPAEQNASSLFRAISGARTHMRQGNIAPHARDMLGRVSGRADLLSELAKIQ